LHGDIVKIRCRFFCHMKNYKIYPAVIPAKAGMTEKDNILFFLKPEQTQL